MSALSLEAIEHARQVARSAPPLTAAQLERLAAAVLSAGTKTN